MCLYNLINLYLKNSATLSVVFIYVLIDVLTNNLIGLLIASLLWSGWVGSDGEEPGGHVCSAWWEEVADFLQQEEGGDLRAHTHRVLHNASREFNFLSTSCLYHRTQTEVFFLFLIYLFLLLLLFYCDCLLTCVFFNFFLRYRSRMTPTSSPPAGQITTLTASIPWQQ